MSTTGKICKCGHEHMFHINPRTSREDMCSLCRCKKFEPLIDKKGSENMGKKLDDTITRIRDFKFATQVLDEGMQMYVQVNDSAGNPGSLIEVTELQVNLAKTKNEQSFLILRCY